MDPDGWEPGSVIEWITSGDGSGANALWLPRLRQRHPQARWLFVDPTGDLFAAGMVRWGFDLSRVIGVRTSDLSQTLWVIEQGLRSEGVEFVWGRVDDCRAWPGEGSSWLRRRDVRLVCSHGGIGHCRNRALQMSGFRYLLSDPRNGTAAAGE